MSTVLGIRFRKAGKMSYTKPIEGCYNLNDKVIVVTDKGAEVARVVKVIKDDNLLDNVDFKEFVRKTSKADLGTDKQNRKEASEFVLVAKKEARKLSLNMKFLLGEYTFDKTKLTLYFISDDRVDFRELVRILATRVKTRLELRQIGARDEVKIFDNIGMCGREVCCRSHLDGFKSVAIKDAKDQGLQINMTKLSGACGKLMCCLKYENETYIENSKLLPKYGDEVEIVSTKQKGVVCGLDILGLKVKIKFVDSSKTETIENFEVKDIKF